MTGAMITAAQNALWQEAERLMLHHTNPWELDEACIAAGFTRGLCEAQDHIGLDRVLARHPKRPVPILRRMLAEGRLGKIGGVGYYRYPGGGGAVIDPLIEDLIREEAWFAKVERSDISDDEITFHLRRAVCRVVKPAPPNCEDIVRMAEALHMPEHLLVQ